MTIHIVLLEAHGWLMAGSPPTGAIPDPPPVAPPGQLAYATNTLLGWMKWGGLVGAVGALIAAGIMMAVGRRNRNNMAIEGAVSVPWVIGGLAMILGSASIVGFLVQ
jgi:hypothetical protein